jgi:hypothetical protein
MRKRALLIVGLALLIAAAGVVYAHWTDTLNMNTAVHTGTVDMLWQAYGTDDDGLNNTGFFGAVGGDTDNGNDPSNMIRCTGGSCLYLDGSITRYDKDVADCAVSLSGDGKTLTATITNAYPSYHCSIFTQLSNEGSVPVKATAFRMTTPAGGTLQYVGTDYVAAAAGDTTWCNQPANAGKCPLGIFVGGDPVIIFDIAKGTGCGTQLDPYTATGDMALQAYWFHVEEAAVQGGVYSFSWSQDFVNWNEWDSSMCTVTITGVTYP